MSAAGGGKSSGGGGGDYQDMFHHGGGYGYGNGPRQITDTRYRFPEELITTGSLPQLNFPSINPADGNGGTTPWNPRANRQPITAPEDQRELYDNAPPGVSIGGGPAPIDRGMPSPGMPGGKSGPGMPGGKSGPGGGFNPFKIDRTPPPNMSPEQQQAFNWQNRMTANYDPQRDQESMQIMKGYYDQNPSNRPGGITPGPGPALNQFTPQFGAGGSGY